MSSVASEVPTEWVVRVRVDSNQAKTLREVLKDHEQHKYIRDFLRNLDQLESEAADPDLQKYVQYAESNLADEDLEIDDDSVVSEASDGAWVMAWVWVGSEDLADYDGSDEEKDKDG